MKPKPERLTLISHSQCKCIQDLKPDSGKSTDSGVTRVAWTICIWLNSHSFLIFQQIETITTLNALFLQLFLFPLNFLLIFCWSVSPSVHHPNHLFSHSHHLPATSHFANHQRCGDNSSEENSDCLPGGGAKITTDSVLEENNKLCLRVEKHKSTCLPLYLVSH